MAKSPTVNSTGGPIFFWREYESPYGFLSQWYASTFTAPAPSSMGKNALPMTFLTTEQYMMYHKAILFDDVEVADQIMLEPEPKKQKSLGRKVKGFDNKKWNGNREKVVEEGNWWKFTQSKEDVLRKQLLDTGDRMLVEVTNRSLGPERKTDYAQASPYDRIWGVGYGAANAEANRAKWGENLLGQAIMRVRDRLRTEEDFKDKETAEE